MRPPRSTRCPRCGFSFAWNGRRCGHCPTPSRARQLWEQIGRFPELVGSNKGITQRQLLAITAACLRRVSELLPSRARSRLKLLEDDPIVFAQKWGQRTPRPRASSEPETVVLNTVQAVAGRLRQSGALDVATVQSAASQMSRAIAGRALPDRDVLSFPLPPELESIRSEVAASLGESAPRGRVSRARREMRDAIEAALEHLERERVEYVNQQRAVLLAEEFAQCEIVRDVLGFPEVPVTFDTNWRTSTAIAIVREMYSSRDFSAMPILADALQDAGCDEPEILEHSRSEKPHVHGCWVCEGIVGEVSQCVA